MNAPVYPGALRCRTFRKLRKTKLAPEPCPPKPRFRKPHLPPGTIVGGFRIASWWGWDISRRTLYMAECLTCGQAAPRTTSNMKQTVSCNACAAKRRQHCPQRRAYHTLPKDEPRRQSIPGEEWPGWRERCDAVASQMAEPLRTTELLRLIRMVAAKRYEQFAARQWLGVGETLGLWHWAAGFWWRTVR